MTCLDLRRHQRFWFSDGSLHLLVEDTLYQVHRYLFEMHATKFPGPLSGIVHASPDQSPYFLAGIKRVDFDRLLAFLYPRDLTVEEVKTPDEWVSILKLASQWGFGSLRAKAVKKVAEFVTPIDQVVFGREHDIPELLLPGYTTLCQSSIPLSQEEGHRLGLEAVINVYGVRQELWGKEIKPISEDITEMIKSFISTTKPVISTPLILSSSQMSAPYKLPTNPNRNMSDDSFPPVQKQSFKAPFISTPAISSPFNFKMSAPAPVPPPICDMSDESDDSFVPVFKQSSKAPVISPPAISSSLMFAPAPVCSVQCMPDEESDDSFTSVPKQSSEARVIVIPSIPPPTSSSDEPDDSFAPIPKQSPKARVISIPSIPPPLHEGKKNPKAKVPKRPLSAYMFFSQDWRERIRVENPGAAFGEVGRLLGAKWKELDSEEKKPYIERAAQDKSRAEKEKAAFKAIMNGSSAAASTPVPGQSFLNSSLYMTSASASVSPQQLSNSIPVPKQPTKVPAVPTMAIPPQIPPPISAPYKLPSNSSGNPFIPVPKQWPQTGNGVFGVQLPSIPQQSSQKPAAKARLSTGDDLQAALDDLLCDQDPQLSPGDDLEAALDDLLGDKDPQPEQANTKSKGKGKNQGKKLKK